MKFLPILFFFIILISSNKADSIPKSEVLNGTFLVILGNLQDAGSPHIACKKDCCKSLFGQNNFNRKVTSLGLIDSENRLKYLFSL